MVYFFVFFGLMCGLLDMYGLFDVLQHKKSRAVPSSVLSFWDTILFYIEVLMRVIIKVGTCKMFSMLVQHFPYFSFFFHFDRNVQ